MNYATSQSKSVLFILYYLLLILLFSFPLNAQEVAFPGAQGWASGITGGRGGKIIRVTNLNPSGTGSLKAAIDASGTKIIVFEVGGVIDISSLPYSRLVVKHDNLTIAGQTAPYPGITIVGGSMVIHAENVIIQHLKIRAGAAGKSRGWEPDCISISSSDIIIDHCSFSWAVDENMGLSRTPFIGTTPDQWRANAPHNITVSNCIIAEGLYQATHRRGAHSKGILASENSTNIAIINNLIHSNQRRNPLFKGGTRGAIINNYIYNPGAWATSYIVHPSTWGDRPMQYAYMTIIGNYMQLGPSSDSRTALVKAAPSFAEGGRAKIYMRDNTGKTRSGSTVTQYVGDNRHIVSSVPTWHNSFKPIPASNLRQYIADNVGAMPWNRDPIDKRIINEMMSNGSKGKIINYETEVGGLPMFTKTQAAFVESEWDLKYMIRKSGNTQETTTSTLMASTTSLPTGTSSLVMGYDQVFPSSSKFSNRRAQPATATNDGMIQSISIYHNGGSGGLQLGVYADEGGKPGKLLGSTSQVNTNGTAGWQSLNLTSPVSVKTGQKVWLAWVFQNNPGVRYKQGSPNAVTSSTQKWSGGMPGSFGSFFGAAYIYSIYATLAVSGNQSARLGDPVKTDTVALGMGEETARSFNLYPNPTTGKFILEIPGENVYHGENDYVIFDLSGRIIEQSFIKSNQIELDLTGNRKGVYMIKVGNKYAEKLFLR